jgi:hypothetical protein
VGYRCEKTDLTGAINTMAKITEKRNVTNPLEAIQVELQEFK